MSAVGYAVLPTTISLSGLSKELQKQVLEPTRKAAKQAAETMEKGIGAGAEAAGRAVEKANFRVMKSTQEQEAAESKLAEQKLKTEAANLAVEAAARKRADAETKGVEAVEKAEQELLKKRAAAEKASRDLRTAEAGVEKALSESARAADNLAEKQRLLDAATEDTEESTKGLRERLREVAQEADSTGGMFDGLVGKVGGMATAFAGIAGVGALVAEGMDISGSIDKMNRQLGLTGEAAEMMGDEVTAVMKSGFGTEDAVSAVGSLTSQFAYLGFEGEQTAQELADNFIAFADTFEVDMAEATQTAGQLVKHGLAGDVEHAADLMTTAMQRVPAAMRDELPEIINEYGVNFKNLGYSGEEAFGMLVAQAENGKIALDKTGDALKEFSLFAVDPAKAEVFESIGINATEMANAVAEGGDKAQAKLQETAEKLLAIEDPGLRATTAIELFGTPLEDLGVEGIPSFLEGLSGMESNMAGAAGSSQALADSIGDSLQGRLDKAKNTVMALAGEGFMALWDVMETKVIPAFKDAGEWVQKNEEWLAPLAATIGGAATAWGLWTAAVKGWEFATKVATGVQLAFNAVMNANPIMLVVTALAAVTAGLVYFFTQTETGREMWDKFTTALSDGWNLAVGALSAGWEWLKTTVFDAWTNTVAAVQAHWNLTTNAIAFAWAWVKDQFVTTWTTVKTAVFDAWNTAVTWVQENFDQVTGAISSAWSWLKDQLHAGYTWVKSNVLDALTSSLDTVKGWFDKTVDAIGTTWDKLKALTAKPVRFVVETVYGGIRNAWNKVAGLVGLGELPEVPLGSLGAYARGGVLPGYTPGRDVHEFYSPTGGRIHLSGGEAIMRPEVTRALGTDRVDALNAAARMGGVRGVEKYLGAYANGGVIGSISNLVREKFPMMTITSTYRAGDPGHHGAGRAVDFSNGTDTTPQMQAATAWFATNYGKELLELIHSPSPHNIKNGRSVGDGFGFYGAGTMNAHRNHVHVAASAPLAGGGSGGVLGFLEGAVTSVADMAKSAWDTVIDKIPAYAGTGGLFGELPGAFLKKAAGAAWSFIADKASSVGAWFGSPGSGVEQWRPLVEKVLTAKGLSLDLADTTLRRMNQESGGNPRAINDWDINAKNGTPSKGLMQVIDPTFAAHKDPGFNDIWDPESNIRASMNYTLARYGSLPAGYNRAGGYHLGGLAPAGRGFMPKTALEPEMVLNPKMTKAFIDWMNGSPRGESAAVVARELAEAFRGGDWGYMELARYLGDDMAKATIAIVSAVGRADRGFREWAAATEEQDRIGTPEEWARHYGAQAGATILDDVLGLFGLGGIVGSPLKASLVDLVNAAADTMNGIHGTRFGHISENALVPAAVLDDQGRAVGTKLVSADSLPEPADTAAAAGGVDATSTTATVTEPPVKEITFEVKGDAVTTEKVSEMFDKLNGELGDTKVRLKKIEDNQTASVTSGVAGIV